MQQVVLREESFREFKKRFFVKTTSSIITHISHLYGKLVRSIVFSRGTTEYYLDLSPEILEVYEVYYAENSTRTLVYEVKPTGLKYTGSLNGLVFKFTSGFSTVDRLVEEASTYRCTWATLLCGARPEPLEYYTVDLLARSSLNYVLYKRLKELILELSREYIGFTLALLVDGLRETGFKTTRTHGEFCLNALSTDPNTWRNTRIVLSSNGTQISIEVEKRIGPVNPDIYIEAKGRRIVVECKNGPPKTWVTKAIKQARLYKELGNFAVLVTPHSLPETFRNNLEQHYDVIVYCNPNGSDICSKKLVEILSYIPSKI